ncbi:unnamed protein product [Mycena citricolor]|uniref:Uncharacterized protein n=1 Tax=Mycena citricolor TaxID=2018698 RepID=A0AAD2H433_9AGAR|nr:unnamed protein product [Mycena citricolor]
MSAFFATSASASASEPARIAAPTPAASRQSATQYTNIVDDFFGVPSSRTRDSRHDSGSWRNSVASYKSSHRDSAALPPPYLEAPEYTVRAKEPVTLAMYLFKFGFLFPPFWIMGVFILFSPLRAPPPTSVSDSDVECAWLPEKTDAERQVIIERLRVAELKWAKRCLYALIALLLAAVAIAIAVWATLRLR